MMNDEQNTNDKPAKSDLRVRTKSFALRVIRVYSSLDKRNTEAQVLGKQLLRSGTSVGAHYREATRARSAAEFISKIEGGLQELEETAYWLELLVEGQFVARGRLASLCKEVHDLIAILVSSVKTAKKHRMKMRQND